MELIKPLDNNSESEHTGGRKSHMRQQISLVYLAVIAALVVVLAGLLLPRLGLTLPFVGGTTTSKTDNQTPSGYQAVFLSNSQVYFGKVTGLDTQYPTISDVYYLRVTQNLQPGQANSADKVKVEKPTGAAAGATQNELTLIKLGNELHGPTDQIQLNREHIIFIENLKEDSKVVKAIRDYQDKNK